MSRLSGGLVRRRTASPAAGSRSAPGRDNLWREIRVSGLASNLAFRRPPGHGADRWHDHRSRSSRGSRTDGCTAGDPATSRAGWRPCSWPSQRLCRERPPGPPRSCWPARWMRNSPIRARRGWPEAAHGADLAVVAEPTLARPGSLPQRRPAVEDPDPGRGLPQLDAGPGGQRHLPDGPGARRPGRVCRRSWQPRRPTRSSARPASRSAGSREGKASTSFPTGARSRSIGGLIPGEQPDQAVRGDPAIPGRAAGKPGRHRIRPPVGQPARPGSAPGAMG